MVSLAVLTRLLERLYEWLSPVDRLRPADAIFALAGRQSRKFYALELYRQGAAGTLLLSVARFEIRKFAQLPFPVELNLVTVARDTRPALRHYFVSLHAGQATVERITRGRFGTLGEIKELAAWLRERPHIRSLLVVSSAPHLRRVRACCRALLPASLRVSFVAVPEPGEYGRHGWWRAGKTRTMVLKEMAKVALYRLVLAGMRFAFLAKAI